MILFQYRRTMTTMSNSGSCLCQSDPVKEVLKFLSLIKIYIALQQAPLNGITLGQSISDPIKRMILLTELPFPMNKPFLQLMGLTKGPKSDSIIRLIPLSVIPLSGAHCISKIQKVNSSRYDYSKNSQKLFSQLYVRCSNFLK